VKLITFEDILISIQCIDWITCVHWLC